MKYHGTREGSPVGIENAEPAYHLNIVFYCDACKTFTVVAPAEKLL